MTFGTAFVLCVVGCPADEMVEITVLLYKYAGCYFEMIKRLIYYLHCIERYVDSASQ